MDHDGLKARVAEFWDDRPCGSFASEETLGTRSFFEQVTRYRYSVQPFMHELIGFPQFGNARVLEVGCGLGTDSRQFAINGASVVGVDLSINSVQLARKHFQVFETRGDFIASDAEHLPFSDGSFDVIYSFGVLHHTPDTELAIEECYRVLKPGGVFISMLYNRRSWHVVVEPHLAWLKRRLLMQALPSRPGEAEEVVRRYDGDSNPLGVAFTPAEVRQMLSQFVDIQVRLCDSRVVTGSWFGRTYSLFLEKSGINRHWGFWILTRCRKPTELKAIDTEQTPFNWAGRQA